MVAGGDRLPPVDPQKKKRSSYVLTGTGNCFVQYIGNLEFSFLYLGPASQGSSSVPALAPPEEYCQTFFWRSRFLSKKHRSPAKQALSRCMYQKRSQ